MVQDLRFIYTDSSFGYINNIEKAETFDFEAPFCDRRWAYFLEGGMEAREQMQCVKE